jgi:tRNA-specific 2-thiouridylase
LFIIDKDSTQNIIYVGKGGEHPGLKRKGLWIANEEIHWIRDDLELAMGEDKDYLLRIRYRQELSKAKLSRRVSGLYIIFEEWMHSIASGQFAAWYDGDELIGSGVIH